MNLYMLHLNMLLSKSSPTVLAGKRLFLVWVLMCLCSSAGRINLFEQDPHFCTGASSGDNISWFVWECWTIFWFVEMHEFCKTCVSLIHTKNISIITMSEGDKKNVSDWLPMPTYFQAFSFILHGGI